MLAIKQEPQCLVMPAQAVVQNQQGVPPQQNPLPVLTPGLCSNHSQILGTPSGDVPNDRMSGEGVRPKRFHLF